MPKLGLFGFDGIVPRTAATMLRDNQAQQADDVRLYRGELGCWRVPAKVFTPDGATGRTIYRHTNADGEYRWLVWETDVWVAPGPSADQTDIRIYYTGDGPPKKTNYLLSATRSYQPLGVPSPTTAPVVGTVTGNALVAETRVYLVTFVNSFGLLAEESAPSPVSSAVTVQAGMAAHLTNIPVPPAAGGHVWAGKRIYRSVGGTSGSNYALVAEIAPGATEYTDRVLSAGLGDALPSLGWREPPAGLTGIVALAGGVLAGFVGNTVYFSEPYYPHAWPVKYGMNVPYNIVGLGVTGSMLVVLTDLHPYVITGVVPGSMSMEKIPLAEPCVSARSIAVDTSGVMYASPNGLVTIGPNMQGVTTADLYRRDEWAELEPSTIVGVVYENQYFGFFRSSRQGNRCFILSRRDIPSLSYFSPSALAAHVDVRTARLFYLSSQDGCIYEVDAADQPNMAYTWRSKRFVLPGLGTFSVLKVDADYGSQEEIAAWNENVAALIAANEALWASGQALESVLNDLPLNTLALGGSVGMLPVPALKTPGEVTTTIYGDGAQVSSTITHELAPVRLSPFRAKELEVEVTGTTPVRSVALATSVTELGR